MDIIEIVETDPRSDLGTGLMQGSIQEQIQRYGRDGGKTVDQLSADADIFIAATLNGEPAGCGALVPFSPGIAELSRIYVDSGFRRRGVAAAIMAWIEDFARGRYSQLVLETGVAQSESLGLYEACGYSPIPCWGNSKDNSKSRCYQKAMDT